MGNFADKNDNSSQNEPESMDKYIEFLQAIKPLSDEIEKIRDEYHFTKPEQFNIFTALSDKYHKENLHSDILKGLLENNYMDDFYDLLKEIKYKNGQNIPNDIEFDNSFTFVREEGRRDISIYSKSQSRGIFIESKINGAKDRDDQLADYYQSLEDIIEQIDVVVYIPPIGSENGPPLNDYSYKYKTTTKKIEEKLLVLPVINKTRNDIVHGFLDEIAKSERNETMRVFIKQYSEFLKNWGEKIMEKKEKQALLKKLLEEKNVEMTYNIWDVCNDFTIIGEIIGKEIKKIGFTTDDEWDYYKIIQLKNNDTISIDFTIDRECCVLELFDENKKKAKYLNKFKEILNDKAFDIGFSPLKAKKYSNGKYSAWRKITYLNLEEKHTIKENIKFVIEKIKILEEKCEQISI
jgi:hypothetical protein